MITSCESGETSWGKVGRGKHEEGNLKQRQLTRGQELLASYGRKTAKKNEKS